MRNHIRLLLIIGFAFTIFSVVCHAQNVFTLDNTILVTQNGDTLSKAWSGGLDCPMYSTIDLNNDGVKDLFIFDHKTNRVTTFINTNQANIVSYLYSPQYENLFPAMHDWALLYDYDCDGYEDIFTHGNGGIKVFHNNKVFPLQFTLITSQINSYFNLGGPNPFLTNVYVNSVSVPAFIDMDNDGDMDILNLANGGNYFEYHKNYSMDSTGLCGGFLFYNIRRCWGYFIFGGINNHAILPPITFSADCPPFSATSPRNGTNTNDINSVLHGGVGFACSIDMEGDGDKDFLMSSDYGTNLVYIENGGNQDSAYAIAQDTLFPSYNTGVIMNSMPAPFILDVNNDGKKDLLVSNFNLDQSTGGGGENYFHSLYYQNVATLPNDHQFQFIKNTFLSEEMIDVGTGAHPAFFDVDGDGLKDLLVASDYFYYNPLKKTAQISYYRNTGTSLNPKYDLITKDFSGISTYDFLGIYPTFGDIDGDGDEDMILGNTNASLTYFKNIGGAGPANFVLDSLNYQNISVGANGQQSTPQLIDLDHDGLLDLVIGRRSGTLYYYHNTGTTTNPLFTFVTNNLGGVTVYDPIQNVGYSTPLFYDSAGTTQLLVGCHNGMLYHYINIDGNLGGSFTLTDTNYRDIYEPANAAPAMNDLNGDGIFDLVIGNLAGGVRCYKQSITASISQINAIDPGFTFYPNPAAQQLTIEFNESTPFSSREIYIYNVVGENVLHLSTRAKHLDISLDRIPTGSYIISVNHKGNILSQKFLKK